MQENLKKFLLSLFVIFILFAFFVFGGVNYIKNYLASLSGIITAFVTINPLGVNVSAPAEVEIGKVFKVEANLINKGEEKIENARGEIFLPPELVLIQKDSVKEVGVIQGKREKKIFWSVNAEKEGNYVISVFVSGELRSEVVTAEGSTLVAAKESLPKGKGRGLLQNLFDFFQEWFGF